MSHISLYFKKVSTFFISLFEIEIRGVNFISKWGSKRVSSHLKIRRMRIFSIEDGGEISPDNSAGTRSYAQHMETRLRHIFTVIP